MDWTEFNVLVFLLARGAEGSEAWRLSQELDLHAGALSVCDWLRCVAQDEG